MAIDTSGTPTAGATLDLADRDEPVEALHPEFQEDVAPPPLGFAALIVIAGLVLPIGIVVAIAVLTLRLLW